VSIDARLAIPAVTCWGGTAALIIAPRAAAGIAVCAAVSAGGIVCALVAARRRSDRPAGRARSTMLAVLGVLAVSLAVMSVAATAVAVAAPLRSPPGLASATQGHVVHVIARVDGDPRAAQSRSAFGPARRFVAATASSVVLGAREYRASIPLTVYLDADGSPQPKIGEVFAFDGTMRAYAPSDETAFTLYTSGDVARVAAAPPIYAWADLLRSRLSSAARRLPGDGAALLPGLSIGDVSAVGSSLSAAMKASSLTHLTAVSGANCAVVIALMMAGGAAIGLRRWLRVALALVALAGFVVLVTPQPSVLRAAVMASIVVFSAAAGRPGRGVPALCIAVIVLLVLNPWLALDYGFALSVLATAGLLVLAPMLAETLRRWLPRSVALALSIPIAAQLACQPVLLMLNPAVPLYGVAANLLAEPAAPIATVVGLIACLLLPLAPAAGTACAWVAWVPSAWIAGVARVTTSLPGTGLPWLTGFAGVAIMAVLTVLIVVAVRPARARGRPPGGSRAVSGALPAPPRRHGRLRRRLPGARGVSAALLVIFVACYIGGYAGGGVAQVLDRPSDWQLGACDIGQGDALLVRDGAAHGLVDVGPDPKPLKGCLSALGIGHIDLLVLTHYDMDHVGGLDAVVGAVTTALVTTPSDAHARHVMSDLRTGGADVRVAQAGDSGTLGRLRWRVLWPIPDSPAVATSNEEGLAVEFWGRGIRSLFLADLDERAQNALLASGAVPRVDVVKVAHHGSADQSTALYDALHARVGMISVGADNDYGHPTASLLQMLLRLKVRILRTDVNGMYLLTPRDDGSIGVWVQRAGTAQQLTTPGDRGG